MPPPDDIVPEDSWVLDVWTHDDELVLRVEAALASTHPDFYWPPKPGEQHAYAQLVVRLRGQVEWVSGPLPKRARDASGEFDFGGLGSWWTADDGTEHVVGEWGEATVRDARQDVQLFRR